MNMYQQSLVSKIESVREQRRKSALWYRGSKTSMRRPDVGEGRPVLRDRIPSVRHDVTIWRNFVVTRASIFSRPVKIVRLDPTYGSFLFSSFSRPLFFHRIDTFNYTFWFLNIKWSDLEVSFILENFQMIREGISIFKKSEIKIRIILYI